MKTVQLPDGDRVPALGQGTWRMGENKSAHSDEVAALRLGIDLGMTLIDTAEMYGENRKTSRHDLSRRSLARRLDFRADRPRVGPASGRRYRHSKGKQRKACPRERAIG